MRKKKHTPEQIEYYRQCKLREWRERPWKSGPPPGYRDAFESCPVGKGKWRRKVKVRSQPLTLEELEASIIAKPGWLRHVAKRLLVEQSLLREMVKLSSKIELGTGWGWMREKKPKQLQIGQRTSFSSKAGAAASVSYRGA